MIHKNKIKFHTISEDISHGKEKNGIKGNQ